MRTAPADRRFNDSVSGAAICRLVASLVQRYNPLPRFRGISERRCAMNFEPQSPQSIFVAT